MHNEKILLALIIIIAIFAGGMIFLSIKSNSEAWGYSVDVPQKILKTDTAEYRDWDKNCLGFDNYPTGKKVIVTMTNNSFFSKKWDSGSNPALCLLTRGDNNTLVVSTHIIGHSLYNNRNPFRDEEIKPGEQIITPFEIYRGCRYGNYIGWDGNHYTQSDRESFNKSMESVAGFGIFKNSGDCYTYHTTADAGSNFYKIISVE